MDYNKILYFLKAAEKMSFTEAAKELFITPQALSHQIAQLEQELGTQLFERSTRRIRLTETGVFCQAQFGAAKLAVDHAFAAVRQKIERAGSLIRIGFFNGLPKNGLVTPVLASLQNSCAGSQLELTSGDLATVFQALRDDKIDLLLTNLADDTDLGAFQAVVLQTRPAMIVISENHSWSGRPEISAEELRLGPMLQFRQTSGAEGHSFYQELGNTAIKYVSDFDTMLATLEDGQHFAVFPQSFDFRERAHFQYIELPEQFRFNYLTVLIGKRSSPKRQVSEILTRFANCD